MLYEKMKMEQREEEERSLPQQGEEKEASFCTRKTKTQAPKGRVLLEKRKIAQNDILI